MKENTTHSGLGAYVRDIFDLNKDGKVTLKEILHTLIPSYAVGVVIGVVDLLMLLAEYRVFDVAMQMTNGNLYKSMGFVAVSALPFYLSQIMWLYPRANTGQLFIAFLVGAGGLATSAMFGLADLSQTYNVQAISRWVIYATILYVIALLTYGLIDNGFRLNRMKIQARERANFEKERLGVIKDVLSDLEESLSHQKQLEERFGPEAVAAHLELMGRSNKKSKNNNGRLPEPVQTNNSDTSNPS